MKPLARYLHKNLEGRNLKRVYDDLRLRRAIDKETQETIVGLFQNLYFESGKFGKAWNDTRWLGTRALKCPFDLWVYQEIVAELRPDLIVETGTRYGGSALFLASICDLINHGTLLTVDIEPQPDLPRHSRIEYHVDSSIAEATMDLVRRKAQGAETVLVILDSDHRRDHVLQEMRLYGPLVTRGSYMIVEDSCVNGHPVAEDFGPGPYEAIEEFMADNRDFVIDKAREKYFMTFNPNGYLRRVT